MKMKSQITNWLSAMFVVAAIATMAALSYEIVRRPYFVAPRQDNEFMASSPSEQQVRERFGAPAEELKAGEKFPPTGWYPLPHRAATHKALSFVRRDGRKIYVFFDVDGRLEEFSISRS